MPKKNTARAPAAYAPAPSAHRTRVNLTMPTWLFENASEKGALKGYGMSELVSRLLEKFVEDEERRSNPPIPHLTPRA